MTWEQRYRLKYAIRTSLVPPAVLSLIAAIIVAPAVRWLDDATGWHLFSFSPDGARGVLAALAGSMLTFIVFVLSATLIVVQLAAGQLTPRIIAMVFAMPWVRITLGVFTFTFAYTLSALARTGDQVPDLHVSVAVVLNLICIVVFFMFVQRLSSGLRPSTMMLFVAEYGRQIIEQVYPQPYDPKRPEHTDNTAMPTASTETVEYAGRAGVVMAFNRADLIRLACDADAVVELLPQVGDSISRGDPLFRIARKARPLSHDALRGCVAIGAERTLEQDPRFVFRILVDIAARALSPAINDPTTAVLAIDHIDALLLCLGRRRLDEGIDVDGGGNTRLVYGTPDWPDFVALAVSEIRHYGGGSIQVDRRLLAMLEHLSADLPASRRPALNEEMTLLRSAIKRTFQDAVDRKRAGVADFQGVGGSES